MRFLNLLWQFTWQQMLCCIFPAVIFLSLAFSKYLPIPFLPRYDLLLIICIIAQLLLIKFGLETWDELKVIMLFHIIGLVLEIYKIHMGSWSYPEAGYAKILGVPLYSGFMYSSVASYICQAWKRFNLTVTNWPKSGLVITLCIAIYLNFFTHHYIWDLRYILIIAVLLLFLRTTVFFTVGDKRLHMPLSLSFLLIAFFIWVAENIASFFGAWYYPNQEVTWHLVGFGKITSWYLLIIISIMIIAELKFLKKDLQEDEKKPLIRD
ncbi:DUF817 domain-containing protein [Listeria booriae]|uniref:DUF817 domain-containing protein n=1 Tax=Listeria booriae TaxID=1552123 RepID=A0A7X1A7Q0_9LIST|nr:DUF817 domain-containing protein [Listeria booriae]MBC2372809.1 DUF817 domain-containing protein [Listeria booriae]